MQPSELLPVALRAYAPPASRPRKSRRAEKHRRSSLVLVFDTETTIDAAQRLTFGSWRLYRRSRNSAAHSPDDYRLIEEGIFYDDDISREARAVLDAYARDHWYNNGCELQLVARRKFVDRVFWYRAYRERALVVGFNLPFDLSRIAVASGVARRGAFAGGISLVLWEYRDGEFGELRENAYRPRIAVKMLGSKRALIGFTSPREVDPVDQIPDDAHGSPPDPTYKFPGHFLDARTLAYVLADRNHSLASACTAFGVEHAKLKVEEHGQVTPEYIDYNRRDVLATFELACALLEEYDRHPISPEYRGARAPDAPTLAETRAYSPASIGKAYMRLMGVRPRLALASSFPPDVLGYAMTAFYGGRAETRIRRVSLPVVYVDFLSMYPTVNALMGLWELVRAERVECVEDRDGFQAWFDTLTPDDCFRPETWRQLVGIALIESDGDVLPVRARYDHAAQGYEIGHNYGTSDVAMWYALADVLASWLITGRKPRVLRVIRFVPSGVQPTLRAVALRGIVEVDPAKRDFFRTVIEQRQRVKRDRSLPKVERERLDAFLKVLANSTSYGIYAEMNQIEETPKKPKPITVHALDAFEANVTTPEEPGAFFFAPFAACITAAARLMLALLEHSVRELGGTHVMTDTDSMAIVAMEEGGSIQCPGGNERLPDGREAVRALSWAEVDQIVARFEALNPYDRAAVPGSILKVERENFDEER